jgi:hypothetical protein
VWYIVIVIISALQFILTLVSVSVVVTVVTFAVVVTDNETYCSFVTNNEDLWWVIRRQLLRLLT